jgi:hypothetical protein
MRDVHVPVPRRAFWPPVRELWLNPAGACCAPMRLRFRQAPRPLATLDGGTYYAARCCEVGSEA